MAARDALVTVTTVSSEPRAELLRGHLLAHGIESVLQNRLTTLMRPEACASAAFRVQLQVRASQAQAAARLVAGWLRSEAAPRAPGAGERCLACGAPLAGEAEGCTACGWTWVEG